MCGRTDRDWQRLSRHTTMFVIIRAKTVYVIGHHAMKTYCGLQVWLHAFKSTASDGGLMAKLAPYDITLVSVGWKGGGML